MSVYFTSVAKISIAPDTDAWLAFTTHICCNPLPMSWHGTIDFNRATDVAPLRVNSRAVSDAPTPGVKVEVPT